MTAGSSFTQVFGGNAVRPTQPSYEALTIAATTALFWPLETTEGVPLVAAQIDVTATIDGLQLQMPPGITGSNGVQTIIANVGGHTFTVTDQAGNQICQIATTQAWIIALTDNSSVNGTWTALQLASTTSSATAGSLAGPGLQAIGSQLQTEWLTTELNANTALTAAYRSTLVVWTGAAGTLQLNASASLTAGWFCAISNEGSAAVTLSTTGGETINGGGSIQLQPGSSGIVICQAGAFNTVGALVNVLSIAQGGTGASTAAGALTNFGGTSIGQAIFTAPTAASVIGLLGLNNFTFKESTVATGQILAAGSSNTIFVCTAALAINLPLTTTLTTSFVFAVYGQGGAVTITPQASDAINAGTAGASYTVPEGSSVLFCTDANGNWWPIFISNTAASPGTWAIAGGTADAITATYAAPNTSLYDGLILGFRALAANATTTPNFTPDSLATQVITTLGGGAVYPGAIPHQYAEVLVRYNLANTRWELMNPAIPPNQWAAAGGAADAITVAPALPIPALYDGLLVGFRAGAANATDAPTLAVSGLAAHPITTQGGGILAPGAIAGAAAEVVVRYNLANTRWELINPAMPNAGPVAPAFAKLRIAVTSNTAIGVTAGAAAVGNGSGQFISLSAVNVAVNASTTGAGGLDTGVIADSTWYYVFVIYNPATLTASGLISLSATAPTLPAGYTFSARFGAVITDGSGNLMRTLQYGRRAQYVVGSNPATNIQIASGSSAYSSVSLAGYVPPTASAAFGALSFINNSETHIGPNANSIQYRYDMGSGPGDVMLGAWNILLETQAVYYAGTGGSSGAYLYGWEDNL